MCLWTHFRLLSASLHPLIKLTLTFASLIVAIHNYSALCFNIDAHSVLVHHQADSTSNNKTTFFGYSVALHKDRGVSWLLIGAPKAQTDQKPTINHAGAVYRCSPKHNKACQQINFDSTGDNYISNRGSKVKIDDKSLQWFGASVSSARENGSIIACAPRYVYYSNNFRRRDPVGSCWVSRGSFDGFLEYAPCRLYDKWGHHKLGSCQAGFSSAISKDGSEIFMGAPGAHVWQGQVFKHSLLTDLTNATSANNPRSEDDSYLGYSIALGKFSLRSYYEVNYERKERPDVAIGVPRGADLTGKVVIVDNELQSLYNITGEQIGSYFGYSLVTADINGDGIDDLIISAPFYYDYAASPLTDNENAYDVGRVYVAVQNFRGELIIRSKHDGFTSRGRFGLALANCGDLDHDGTDDIAIGAPYGGTDKHGAVYIYNGRKGFDGLNSKYSQVIYANDIEKEGKYLRAFGWSLSSAIDVDDNQYPDLLVGDYESSRALLFLTRPVVNATLEMTIQPRYINLKEKNCVLPTSSSSRVTCLTVQYCLQFTGSNVQEQLEFVFDIKLDASFSVTSPRLSFFGVAYKHREKVYSTFSKGIKQCRSFKAYIVPKTKDLILKPIQIEIDFNLLNGSTTKESVSFEPKDEFDFPTYKKLTPILDSRAAKKMTKAVSIVKHCGKDNICYPNLRLFMKSGISRFDEADEEIRLSVSITNMGDDAFESMFYLTMPASINYIVIEKKGSEYPLCFGTTGSNTLICDLGSPLVKNSYVNFTIIMKPTKKPFENSGFTFLGKVNSSNKELNSWFEEDNQIVIDVPSFQSVNILEDTSHNTGSTAKDNKIVTKQNILVVLERQIHVHHMVASFFVATILFILIVLYLKTKQFFVRKKIVKRQPPPSAPTSLKTLEESQSCQMSTTFWSSYYIEKEDVTL